MNDWTWNEAEGKWIGGEIETPDIADNPIRSVCGCPALNHPLHKPGRCDEPGQPTGEGTCFTCRLATSPAR